MAKHVETSRVVGPRRNELELFMECEEEELAPSQQNANYKAQTDYKSALQKIEEAKTVHVPKPGPTRKSTTVAASRSTVKKSTPVAASLSTVKKKKRDSEDIIVIEDDPEIVSRSPGKRGRPPTKTIVFSSSAFSNILIQPNSSLVQTLASTTSNLSLVSSNMSNMMPVAPGASPSVIFPSNAPSFLTLPTTLQSNSIGLTMGKKVLLAMPVTAAGKQTLVLPAGIKQLQVINALQSANSIYGTQPMKVPDPVIFLASGPNSTVAGPKSTPAVPRAMPAGNKSTPAVPKSMPAILKSTPAVPKSMPAVPKMVLAGSKSTPERPKLTPEKLKSMSGGLKSTPAQSSYNSLSANQYSPKQKRPGRPRKVYEPCSDDDVQVVEMLEVEQPTKLGRPHGTVERKHSGSGRAVGRLESAVSPTQSVSVGQTAVQLPKGRRGRVGRPKKVMEPSSDDDVQIVEPMTIQPKPMTIQPKPVKVKPVSKSPDPVAPKRAYVKRKTISNDETSLEAVQTNLRSSSVGSRRRNRSIEDLIEPIVASGLGVRQITTDDDDGTLSLAEEVQKWVIPTSVERVRRVRCKRRNILLGIEDPVASTLVPGTSGIGVKRTTRSDDESSLETIQKKRRSTSIGFRRQNRSIEATPSPATVSGTSGIGIKRPNVSDEDTKSSEGGQKKPRMSSVGRRKQTKTAEAANKPAIRKKQDATNESEEKSNTWIPLDEYYYGKKEGDPTYREDKGEYRFRCWYCHKMLYNNLRLMLHMQGHIDNDKQQNLDLSDLTQCRHCYKQFDTPFEMQCHIEKVHQNNSNVLVCRICEKDHENQSLLQQHMKSFHLACEMPYSCKLCNYRSSIYSDVVDHFKKRHDSSQYILCLYCLKIFTISFYKTAGWGMTQNYYQHIQKHQNKGNNKKCVCCKLTFLTKQETDDHRTKDHMPNYRGIQSGHSSKKTVNRDKQQILICMPEAPSVKLLNAPATSKVLEIRVLRFQGVNRKHLCMECKKPMNTPYHYKNYVECTLCRFATSCNDMFSSHMMARHSGVESEAKTVSRKDAKMTKEMFCLCGFSSLYGSFMANHLVSCSKRTCYSSQPEMKYFEYDDEQEEFTPFEPYVEESEILRQECSSPDADVPSLFGVLGLVKKPRKYGQRHSKVSGPRSRPEVTAEAVVSGIIEDILDSICPAERAVSEVISYILDQVDKTVRPRGGRARKKSQSVTALPSAGVDSILLELTGPRKWKTVRISDSSTPSKKAIFLGSEADFQEGKSVDDEMLSVSAIDAPAIEPVVTETALLSPTKVRPHVCDGEDGDIFWNMPDIEKMESSDEVEDSRDSEENDTKDASLLEREIALKQPENAGGVEDAEEEECDEDEETVSEDKVKVEMDVMQPEDAGDVEDTEEEECDEDEEAVSEDKIKVETDVMQPEDAGDVEDAEEEKRHQADEEVSEDKIKVEMDLKQPESAGVVDEADEDDGVLLDYKTRMKPNLKQPENAGCMKKAEEEERDQDKEAVSEDKIKVLMDLMQPENAGGVEDKEVEKHDGDDEAILYYKVKTKLDLLQPEKDGVMKDTEEEKSEDKIKVQMDLMHPEKAGGVTDKEEEKHGDDGALLDDKKRMELDLKSSEDASGVEAAEEEEHDEDGKAISEDKIKRKMVQENAGGVEDTEEEERDEDDGAILDDKISMELDLKHSEDACGVEEAEEKEEEYDDALLEEKIGKGVEDYDLQTLLVNESEYVRVIGEVTKVECAVSKPVDSDETDAENGTVVKSSQQSVSNPTLSVEDLLEDAAAKESCVASVEAAAGVEDAAGVEEHEPEMHSVAEDREVNLEGGGSEISLGFNIHDDGCEFGFPYKVDSIGGEGSVSPCHKDVVSSSLFNIQSEEDSDGKEAEVTVYKCDFEAEVDVAKLGSVQNVEELLYSVEPESVDFDQDLLLWKEDHTIVGDSYCDMLKLDQQLDNVVGEMRSRDEYPNDSIKPDEITDQQEENLPVDNHKKCDYLLVDTELDTCDTDQKDHDINHEENHDYQDTERDTCDVDQEEDHGAYEAEHQITEQEADQDEHVDQDLEKDTADVGSFSNNNEDCSNDKDVETALSFHLDAYIAVGQEYVKNEDTEQAITGVSDEGCFVDQQDSYHANREDHLAVDPCSSVGLQDIWQDDKTIASYLGETESHDSRNVFNESDESNAFSKLTEKDSLGFDSLETSVDAPASICLNENDSLASATTTTEGLQMCDENQDAVDSQKSEIQDQSSQENKAHHSSGSEEKRGQADSCADGKESHSPKTSFPKSPPGSVSDRTSRQDSHHSDSSHHKDRGYGSRDSDRRTYNPKDYDRRGSEQRDYDRRDYDRRDYDRRDSDRRDYDRRDYDRRDYDRRDYDRRYYDHNDQRPYDRSGSGHRYESHSHGNRRERDDRYDRHSDSRSGQSRNSGHGKGHDSSNSNRWPHHPY